jgi:hypothetical protein
MPGWDPRGDEVERRRRRDRRKLKQFFGALAAFAALLAILNPNQEDLVQYLEKQALTEPGGRGAMSLLTARSYVQEHVRATNLGLCTICYCEPGEYSEPPQVLLGCFKTFSVLRRD